MSMEISSSALQLYFENYKAQEDTLSIYINHNQEESWNGQTDKFEVLLGKEELQVVQVESVEEASEPVTYLCLVDVSGSLDATRMEEMKTVILHLADNMKEGDNLCIVAMGDELRPTGFLTDIEAIRNHVQELAVLKEDTNLYQGITESIQMLLTDENVNIKRCLVVLSDGAEDNTHGITREEVDDYVKESHVPIYTVGMIKNEENQAQLDSVKILGSFARISAGGNHYVPKLDGIGGEAIAEAISRDMASGLIVQTCTEGLTATGHELYLQITVDDENYGAISVGVNVADGNILPKMSEEIPQETTSDMITEETKDVGETEVGVTVEEEGSQNNYTVPIVIGAGFLLLLIIMAVLAVNSKKKRKMTDSKDVAEEADAETIKEEDQTSEIVQDVENIAELPKKTESARDICCPEIRLIRMGICETKTISFKVADKVSFGRDITKSDIALSEDLSLSGRHCIFSFRGGSLYLEDANSTNGTFVNGVPVAEIIRLHQDDVLLLGSYEYRICW